MLTLYSFPYIKVANQSIEIPQQRKKKLDISCNASKNISSFYNKEIPSYFSFKSKYLGNKILDIHTIKNMKIGNLQFVGLNGLRGETLSSKRHRRFIPELKKCGLTAVIDLRDKFINENYQEMCESVGLKYFHIPIDSFKLDTIKIINQLSTLFNVMNNENYYMACALGLHRTDIAQTINYLFNPKACNVPVMYGHQRNGVFKKDDIMRRIGSIKKEITPEQLQRLGWKENEFETIYQKRKERYNTLNSEWAKQAIL